MFARWWEWLWGGRRDSERADAPKQSGGGGSKPPQPEPMYAPDYQVIISQGHTRPTPSFGAPTLVWHVGIWPRTKTRPGADGKSEDCDPQDTRRLQHDAAQIAYATRRQAWIEQINAFIAELQRNGRGRRDGFRLGSVKQFDSEREPARSAGVGSAAASPARESIGFTIWWRDAKENPAQDKFENAIRVRVQVELHADYVTFSFFMDAGRKPDGSTVYRVSDATSFRRRRILRAVEDVRTVCEAQMLAPTGQASIDAPALPEQIGAGEEAKLRNARNVLYVEMWEDFCRELGATLPAIVGRRGDVFANFRGLVMETGGLPDPNMAPERAAAMGSAPFPVFDGDAKGSGEPNAVVKGFWPFIRRITPNADYREFTASGVLNWRAIYISALGSWSQYDNDEERDAAASDIDEPSTLAHRSDVGDYVDSLVEKLPGERGGSNHPIRYLLLTKCQPHPRQVGRIIERINALGTTRLCALKGLSEIRDADPRIRILGQELDSVIRQWGEGKRRIESLTSLAQMRSVQKEPAPHAHDDSRSRYVPGLAKVEIPAATGKIGQRLWLVVLSIFNPSGAKTYGDKLEKEAVDDVQHACLYELTRSIDTQLVRLGALLDDLGSGTSGGFHFRLNRAAYHIKEFRVLLKTLEVGNIPTWISYKQFVARGLSPSFDYIASIGKRLASLRARLQSVISAIETSALVVQSAATRYNTAVLRSLLRWGVVAGSGGLLFAMLKLLQVVQSFR